MQTHFPLFGRRKPMMDYLCLSSTFNLEAFFSYLWLTIWHMRIGVTFNPTLHLHSLSARSHQLCGMSNRHQHQGQICLQWFFSTQYVCRLSGCLSTASQSVTVDPRWITGMEELSKSETEPIIGHILNVFFSKCLPETRSRFALIIHFMYYCCVYWMVKLQAALTLLSCSLFSIKILHNLLLHDSKRKSHLP